MCPVPATDTREWVPLTHAAAAAQMTCYGIKTAVTAGLVGIKVIPGFPPRYNLPDALRLAESLHG